jgi:hypothetical protein
MKIVAEERQLTSGHWESYAFWHEIGSDKVDVVYTSPGTGLRQQAASGTVGEAGRLEHMAYREWWRLNDWQWRAKLETQVAIFLRDVYRS